MYPITDIELMINPDSNQIANVCLIGKDVTHTSLPPGVRTYTPVIMMIR